MNPISVELMWKRSVHSLCNRCHGRGSMSVVEDNTLRLKDCTECSKTGLTPIPWREVMSK